MKTKEELNELKERLEKLNAELHELTDDELEQVTGGKSVAKLEDELGKADRASRTDRGGT